MRSVVPAGVGQGSAVEVVAGGGRVGRQVRAPSAHSSALEGRPLCGPSPPGGGTQRTGRAAVRGTHSGAQAGLSTASMPAEPMRSAGAFGSGARRQVSGMLVGVLHAWRSKVRSQRACSQRPAPPRRSVGGNLREGRCEGVVGAGEPHARTFARAATSHDTVPQQRRDPRPSHFHASEHGTLSPRARRRQRLAESTWTSGRHVYSD